MTITRRRLLQTSAAAGLGALLLPSCGDDDGAPPPPPDGGDVDAGPMDAGERPDAALPPPATGPFRHGVASGDPLDDRVILWTRYTPADPATAGTVTVLWEIATDPGFASVTNMGTFDTNAERDFTVKVDATDLAPATTYYYRFRVGSDVSPIGRTRTAPAEGASVARLRFAVCACSSYGHGYFLGYRDLAARADLDAVIHTGDYIYEYGTAAYGDARAYDPPTETVTLEDYRRRYAQYRLDPYLAEAHRQHPWITTWDDHETTNDAWRDGAENHQASEGSYADRKVASARAYAEWMPFREQTPIDKLWRTLRYGALADLIVLDTRRWGRDEQAASSSPALMDPARTLLGADQEMWAAEQLRSAAARWKLVVQQVVMSPFPLVLNTDAWDGYAPARRRFLDVITSNEIDDVIVLTGDIHMSFAFDLTLEPKNMAAYDPATGRGSICTEMVVPGISSPGLTRSAQRGFEPLVRTEAPHIKGFDVWRRGYAILDLTPERAEAAWYLYADPRDLLSPVELGFVVSQRPGDNHFTAERTPSAPPASPPPLAP
jgi:alkaline phosphatase D